jgi:lysophospholipase L1-like esterase
MFKFSFITLLSFLVLSSEAETGSKKIDSVIFETIIQRALSTSTPPDWAMLATTVSTRYSVDYVDRNITRGKIYYYFGRDWALFCAAIVHYTEAYENKNDASLMHENADFILIYSTDPKEWKTAQGWVKHVLDLDPANQECRMTYKNLSAKLDWPNLSRYRGANETLKDKKIRVVFMGNSITDFWIEASPDFFEVNDFVDRGISGQTSPQMLLRFRADVIKLHPQAVVIECGTNDIAGNTGPSTLEMIEDNISSMTELAQANHIKVILGSVLPANKFGWSPKAEPADKIIELNVWIKQFAEKNHYGYIDYYSSLVDDQKGFKAAYSEDGVHPNKEGYSVMEKIAKLVIRKLIGKE